MDNTYRILADGHTISNDTWQTGLNNNDLIIGPSGAGKTRGYVKPNILQCSGSMIVTDTKGALCSDVGTLLAQEGYKVMEINLADCALSPYGYNPLAYIRQDREGHYQEQDILTLAACLMPVESRHDPYWELTARIYLESAISYVLETLPGEERHLGSVVRLISEMGKDGKYKSLMRELEVVDPDSFALSRYRLFKSVSDNAEKTAACIFSFLASKLAPFSFGGAKGIFDNPKKINLKELGRKKTAVFLNISDTDDSMYRIANVFYTQALHTLCDLADKSPGHRLKVPVRFYLDDFASNVVIPDFDRIISVIRSREISVSVIIQSLSQLESLYGQARAMTVINNCDNLLCLGAGRDLETARYISYQANKPVSAILNTPLDSAWLLTRGSKAEQAVKYDLRQHRLYHRLPEAAQPESNTLTQYQNETAGMAPAL
ncbi:MAG: type IV secretory system conjugative DNA transfer family protein [Lachnospiraceae bacterium]|nr:type IV secretory system conjugative DNA transfer family protein [Lachnospiraceae bacterium]